MSPNLDAIRERHQHDTTVFGRAHQQPIRDIAALFILLDKQRAANLKLRTNIAMLAAGWQAGVKYLLPEEAKVVQTCADQIDVLLEMMK